jgi:hypothetical protein
MLYERVGNEVIVIDLQSGHYFHITGSGTEIWTLLLQQPTPEYVEAVMSERYPGSEHVATEARAFLTELKSAEIVSEDEGEAHAAPTPDLGAVPATYQPPVLVTYTNMSDLLLLDPIHDVDDYGWPHTAPPSN